MAAYTYLPWVRDGLIGAVDAGTIRDGRLELSVRVTVSGAAGGTTEPVNVLLFGPGDVTGFDSRQILRTDPPNLAPDFEPNYFPLVEFDRPDFPWLMTPATSGEKNQLTPWICLIVVEQRDGVTLKGNDGQPLPPVLTIESGARSELPDLSEAWAWAHAQIASVTSDDDLLAALAPQSERSLSRLMCPRRLKPKTSYFACIVPTFKGGVQAGLGTPGTGAEALDPAWSVAADAADEIRLPVYYSWEFATGAEGDFEALVWQLERRRLTFDQVGTRNVDISSAGYGLPASAAIDVEGALGPERPANDTGVGPSTNFQQRLQALLNETTTLPPLPVLPPPIYGRWHALQRTIPDPIAPGRTRDRPWLRTLNLDPRYRVAAGLGAQVVREQQEQLMASAWDQVGQIERANQALRQAQLALAASRTVHDVRLGKLDTTAYLQITGPVQPRVRYTAQQTGHRHTARGHLKDSALPVAVTSAQFRRALRPRGPVARRFGVLTAAARSALVSSLNQGQISAAPHPWPKPRGMLGMESVLDRNPCKTNALALAKALIEAWPAERLIAALEKIIQLYSKRTAEIQALGTSVRQQVESAVKSASTAEGELRLFQTHVPDKGAKYLDLVLSYYKPAMSQIAEVRWLLQRVAGLFQPPRPKVVDELDAAAKPLPDLQTLRDINFELALLASPDRFEPCTPPPPVKKPPLDLDELKRRLQEQLDPALTLPARIASLIDAPDGLPADLDIVLAAPDFPSPMYKALAVLSADWLLPGLQQVPPNTVALLQTNTRFIEAFMVGLNHEMSRELLWRGYPTDQRGTYFRQFWDPSGRFAPPADDAERAEQLEAGKDIPRIHEWNDDALGSHFGKSAAADAAAPAAPVVLLCRGELLRRYPRANIYLAQAKWSLDADNNKILPRNPTATEKYPIFRGELAPDVQLLGFDVDAAVARGSDEPANDPNDDGAGWFVVIEQQPTEPRYGLDDTAATSAPAQWTWRDLSWVHTQLTNEYGYVRLAAGLQADFPASAQRGPAGEDWAWVPNNNAAQTQPDSAQIACITLQGPVRVAVHASDLL